MCGYNLKTWTCQRVSAWRYVSSLYLFVMMPNHSENQKLYQSENATPCASVVDFVYEVRAQSGSLTWKNVFSMTMSMRPSVNPCESASTSSSASPSAALTSAKLPSAEASAETAVAKPSSSRNTAWRHAEVYGLGRTSCGSALKAAITRGRSPSRTMTSQGRSSDTSTPPHCRASSVSPDTNMSCRPATTHDLQYAEYVLFPVASSLTLSWSHSCSTKS